MGAAHSGTTQAGRREDGRNKGTKLPIKKKFDTSRRAEGEKGLRLAPQSALEGRRLCQGWESIGGGRTIDKTEKRICFGKRVPDLSPEENITKIGGRVSGMTVKKGNGHVQQRTCRLKEGKGLLGEGKKNRRTHHHSL